MTFSGVALAISLAAASVGERDVTDQQNALGLGAICNWVENGRKDDDESSIWTYHFQRVIYKAAGVSTDRARAERDPKVFKLWSEVLQYVTCDTASFNVENGSLLKFAVNAQFDAFIYDVAKKWNVPLNKVDASDGRTVLDYIRDERAKDTTSSIKEKHGRYYDQLRAAGAKHRRELP